MGRPRTTLPRFAPLLWAPALLAASCFHSQFRTKPRVAVVEGDPIVQMAPPGDLPSLDHPEYVPLSSHTDPPPSSQPVLGVPAGEGEERAYPVGLLEKYEVVNDEAEDVDYVVARCALTDITAVYDRRLDGRLLTFINSGALWRDTLVLQDLETGSLWTAATGAAIYGPLAGRKLRSIPAIHASSSSFRKAHPAASYLDTKESTRPPVSLSLYAASPWQGFSGVKTSDKRFDPKARLFCVTDGREALAFRGEDLKKQGRVEDNLGGRPILLEWDPAEQAPSACRPGADGGFEEVAVIPIYWFALDRHFQTVRTLPPPPPPRTEGERAALSSR
jgi:hypothetical protein